MASFRPSAGLAWALAGALLGGCATRSADVRPAPTDPARYAGWSCERLFDESDRLQQRAADVAYAVDARVGNNMIALGLGVTVFWPALLAMRPDGLEATELADLKGRYEAVTAAAAQRGCGTPPTEMASQRAATLPVGVGDRLVYDDRVGQVTAPRELGMRVTALRRDRLEFALDLDGKAVAGAWQQDLSGNPAVSAQSPLHTWRRLLRPDLALGDTVAGDLLSPGLTDGDAKLRGQVVARGPQTLTGRKFDVLVIELFGDAPVPGGTSTRLDGVMAVDASSGVLLRLELRSGNPAFSVRRRLVRVEAAPGPTPTPAPTGQSRR